ncbi:hypothetical protein RvY_17012 [Ramazzottius varieornatus]|uniref:Uncharacterized protein n=1 Tax=Ramazzottius varieornatus TaxID=947166 RepID=A0A1D1W1I9_RAMVA|nr:hypothetical protein RvY_17012 [Ramazzottius varieornatus]
MEPLGSLHNETFCSVKRQRKRQKLGTNGHHAERRAATQMISLGVVRRRSFRGGPKIFCYANEIQKGHERRWMLPRLHLALASVSTQFIFSATLFALESISVLIYSQYFHPNPGYVFYRTI